VAYTAKRATGTRGPAALVDLAEGDGLVVRPCVGTPDGTFVEHAVRTARTTETSARGRLMSAEYMSVPQPGGAIATFG